MEYSPKKAAAPAAAQAKPSTQARERAGSAGIFPAFLGRQLAALEPASGPQAKACGCGTCPACAGDLVPPPGGRQAYADPAAPAAAERAEAQADEIGAAIGADLAGAGPIGAGPLPAPARAAAERHVGVSLEGTRLIGGAAGHERASAARALAVTEGTDVAFRGGRIDSASSAGRALIGHELTHVAQQRAHAAPPVAQRNGDGTNIGMSVTIQGIYFIPEGMRFNPGPREPQAAAIALQRLAGDDYYPGMENDFISDTHPDFYGRIAGDATELEDTPPFWWLTDITWDSISWLELRGLEVALTPEQLEIVAQGHYASDAFARLRIGTLGPELGQPLPPWYSEPLFVSQMASHGPLLRRYVAAAQDLEFEDSAANQEAVRTVLRDILDALNPGATVMEAVRSDEALIQDGVYWALWPAAVANEAVPVGVEPTHRMAEPDEEPDAGVASLFLTYLETQPGLRRRALDSHEDRVELLDRFDRYAGRVIEARAPTGDQPAGDAPSRANAPAIPAQLLSYPPLEPPLFDSSIRSAPRFVMSFDYTNPFQVFARYSYDWSYVRVPDERIGEAVDPDSLAGETPGFGAVAARRFSLTARHSLEDIENTVDSFVLFLGPIGVQVATLLAANTILRFLGTGIGLGIDFLTMPRSEREIAFPSEGLYIVRCHAFPVVDEDAEIVREPSVAYLPILVRSPEAMAEERVSMDVASRGAAAERLGQVQAELAALAENRESSPEQDLLEREERALTASLGSSADVMLFQISQLEERRDSLPQSAREREQIEDQITDLRTRLQVRRDQRRDGHEVGRAERLIASFVSDEGQVVRLTLDAVDETPEGDDEPTYWVADRTTTRDSAQTGSGETRSEAILDAVREIMRGLDGYGRGELAIHIDGTLHHLRIDASLGSILMEALENVSTAISIAAVAAAPFTGGASLALLVPAGILGAIPSAYRIILRGIDGTLRLDLQTAMDIVNIVGTLVGLGGETAAALRLVWLGRALMIAGIGFDGMGMLLMTVSVVDQIMALQDLPPGERAAQITRIIGQAMISVGIMVGSSLQQAGRAREMGEGGAPLEGGEGVAPHAAEEGPMSRLTDEPATPRMGAQEPDPRLIGVESTQHVELSGEPHSVRVVEEDGLLAVELCTDCQLLRRQIERVLGDPDVRADASLSERLQALHGRATQLEIELNRSSGADADAPESTSISREEARRECDAIAAEMAQLAEQHGALLNPMVGIPRGFSDRAAFERFGEVIDRYLGARLQSVAEAWIGGSSVTGTRRTTGARHGADSDLNVDIVSPELLADASRGGATIHDGTHTGRNPAELDDVLQPLRDELSALVDGRAISITIYGSRRGMEGHGDHIAVPRPERPPAPGEEVMTPPPAEEAMTPPVEESTSAPVEESTSPPAAESVSPPVAEPAAPSRPARVTEPVPGVFESAAAGEPPGWTLRPGPPQDRAVDPVPGQAYYLEPDGVTRTLRLDVTVADPTAPGGTVGGFIDRSYNPQTGELTMHNAFLDRLPSKVDVGTPMAEGEGPARTGRGTPTQAWLTMRIMHILGAGYGEAQHVTMSTIQNMRSIMQLDYLMRGGMSESEAILQTHSVSYAETTLQQSGHQIIRSTARVYGGDRGSIGRLLRHYERWNPSLVERHNAWLREYGLTRDSVVWHSFYIEFDVAPFAMSVE